MTVELLQQIEAVPATWPDAPTGLSDGAAALPAAMIWARIEAWVAWRWTARDMSWVVSGPGDWSPPLTPVTVSTVELWDAQNGVWTATALTASPLGGYVLDGEGPYRFTGSGGDSSTPRCRCCRATPASQNTWPIRRARPAPRRSRST